MVKEDLMALLQHLQGSGAGGVLSQGLLGQMAPLFAEFGGGPKPAAGAENGGGVAGKIASAAFQTGATVLTGGGAGGGAVLTLLPVVGALLKLFGVGKKEEPPPLAKFELPAPIQAEAGLSRSGETFLIDRGAGEQIRQIGAPARPAAATDNRVRTGEFAPGFERTEPAGPSFPFRPETARSPSMGGANITVNVQAMDSQSFLDRREDIARAVREAMLQSHSLNDVVSEI